MVGGHKVTRLVRHEEAWRVLLQKLKTPTTVSRHQGLSFPSSPMWSPTYRRNNCSFRSVRPRQPASRPTDYGQPSRAPLERELTHAPSDASVTCVLMSRLTTTPRIRCRASGSSRRPFRNPSATPPPSTLLLYQRLRSGVYPFKLNLTFAIATPALAKQPRVAYTPSMSGKHGPPKGHPACIEGGRKGGLMNVTKGVDFKALGQLGGNATVAKYGAAHLSRIGGKKKKKDESDAQTKT